MTRIFLIAVACITLVAFVGACGKDAKQEEPVSQSTPEKLKKVEPQKAPVQKKKISQKVIEGRKRYEAFADARIRDAETTLEDMKLRAVKASGRSRRAAERRLRDLRSYIHEAHVNLDKLEKANAKTWEQSKQQVEGSLAKLSRYSN